MKLPEPMLRPHQPMAIHMEGFLGGRYGKMGHSALRYAPNPVVCVIDSRYAGRDVQEVIRTPRGCPVVATVPEAVELGAEVLLLGAATSGGFIPPEWLPAIDEAVRLGLSIVNGLHEPLAQRYPELAEGQWVWDMRKEPEGLRIATGAARNLSARRVLLAGTDMAVGKMTAGLELHAAAKRRGIRTEFLATGQVGMVLTGRGIPLDAIRLDFAAGAVETLVLSPKDAELILLEGQGSLLHPASSATLPLMRGLCPTHLVLCHRPAAGDASGRPDGKTPPLGQVVRLYEDVAEACGLFPRPRTAGVALDTSALDDAAAAEWIRRIQDETNLPTTDVVRFGCEELLDSLLR